MGISSIIPDGNTGIIATAYRYLTNPDFNAETVELQQQTGLSEDKKVTIKDYYLKMIERMEEGLPANWDGVFRATSK